MNWRILVGVLLVVLVPLALCILWNLAWQGPRHKDVGLYGGMIIMFGGTQVGSILLNKYSSFWRKKES